MAAAATQRGPSATMKTSQELRGESVKAAHPGLTTRPAPAGAARDHITWWTLSAPGRRAQGPETGQVYKSVMSDSPVLHGRPKPPTARRRVDQIVAIAALVVVAVVLILALALSHPARDKGVGGRVPTISQPRR